LGTEDCGGLTSTLDLLTFSSHKGISFIFVGLSYEFCGIYPWFSTDMSFSIEAYCRSVVSVNLLITFTI
jgi:hypothetical protein